MTNNSTNPNIVSDARIIAKHEAIVPIRAILMIGTAAILALTLVMWLINIWGAKEYNAILAFVGVIGIIFWKTKPDFITALLATEGAFLAWRSLPGVRSEASAISFVTTLTTWLLFFFSMNSVVLATWSFEESYGAFWMLEFVIFTATLLAAIYGTQGVWTRRLSTLYLICVTISLIWSTFGPAYNQGVFDPETGEALHMVDPTTGKLDPEGRTPAECAAAPCFSPTTGEKLVPASSVDGLRRNPSDWVAATVGSIGDINLTGGTENAQAADNDSSTEVCRDRVVWPHQIEGKAFEIGECPLVVRAIDPDFNGTLMMFGWGSDGISKPDYRPHYRRDGEFRSSYRSARYVPSGDTPQTCVYWAPLFQGDPKNPSQAELDRYDEMLREIEEGLVNECG